MGHVGLENEQSFTNNLTTSDFNLYFNLGYAGNEDSSSRYYSFSQWQALGFDTHGVTADPNLDSNYIPQAGSAAIGKGTNLTSQCTGNLVALCSDTAGNPRPSSGAWDMGAHQYSSQTGSVAPPGSLNAVVH